MERSAARNNQDKGGGGGIVLSLGCAARVCVCERFGVTFYHMVTHKIIMCASSLRVCACLRACR